jgi:hypothetical protein
MPPLEAFGPALAVGLILLVMGWFAWGTQRNIRTGNRLLTWLQAGLPLLGRRTTMRWLGSSAVELGIVKPAPPFREATVTVVLEPRDVSVLWALARSRGRRDFVILRLNLTRPPRFSMDLRDPRGWTSRWEPAGDQAAAGDGDGWHPVDGPAGTVARATSGSDDASVRRTWNHLTRTTAGVWRLTIQPVVPHLEIHFLPPEPDRVSAEQVLGPVRELATMLDAR